VTRTHGGVRGSPHQLSWWGSLLDYQLGVLDCQWFEMIFQFSHSVFSVLKDLVFLVSAKSAMANRQALWQVLDVRWFVRPDIVLGCVRWIFVIVPV